MTEPLLDPIAEELYDVLGPWKDKDQEVGEATGNYPLKEMCQSVFGGSRLQVIESLIRDTPASVGWSSIMDADNAGASWLGWLGQFAGVRLPEGLQLAEARTLIHGMAGLRRGSAQSMRAVIGRFLTPSDGRISPYVIFKERVGGNAYRLAVRTLESETPTSEWSDPPTTTMIFDALMQQKPAGVVLDWAVITGITWDLLSLSYDDWTTVKSTYATWTDVRENLPT